MMGAPPPAPPEDFEVPFYMKATLFFFVNIIIWLVIGYITGTAMWLVLLVMVIFLVAGGVVMWFFVHIAGKEEKEAEEKEWWE